jgi:N-acyl-D-aspartate/D-glutamate deacylase
VTAEPAVTITRSGQSPLLLRSGSTGATADMYRIPQRGYLRPGYFADVVVLDPKGYAPRADYLHPRETSVGVVALFVNGRRALTNGTATGAAAGRALLRPRPAGCDQ